MTPHKRTRGYLEDKEELQLFRQTLRRQQEDCHNGLRNLKDWYRKVDFEMSNIISDLNDVPELKAKGEEIRRESGELLKAFLATPPHPGAGGKLSEFCKEFDDAISGLHFIYEAATAYSEISIVPKMVDMSPSEAMEMQRDALEAKKADEQETKSGSFRRRSFVDFVTSRRLDDQKNNQPELLKRRPVERCLHCGRPQGHCCCHQLMK